MIVPTDKEERAELARQADELLKYDPVSEGITKWERYKYESLVDPAFFHTGISPYYSPTRKGTTSPTRNYGFEVVNYDINQGPPTNHHDALRAAIHDDSLKAYKLTNRQRESIVLWLSGGHTEEEAARIIGISRSTYRTYLKLAFIKIHKRIHNSYLKYMIGKVPTPVLNELMEPYDEQT